MTLAWLHQSVVLHCRCHGLVDRLVARENLGHAGRGEEVSDDQALVQLALERFEALGLSWHAEQSRRLLQNAGGVTNYVPPLAG